MNKLVIHPKDKSTDFLKPIYHGRNDTTVITGGCTKEDVNTAIDEHDHIIILGHGTPQGLLAMNQFNGKAAPRQVYQPVGKPSTAIRKSLTGLPLTKTGIKDFYTPSQTIEDEDDWFASRKVGGYDGSYVSSLTSTYIIDDETVDRIQHKKLTMIWCNADQYMEWNDLEGFYTGMFISEEGEARMIGTADVDKWQVEESNYAFVSIVRRFLDHSAEKLRDALMLEYGEMAERNAVAKYNLKRFYTRKALEADMLHSVRS
jgi:hypothetical protein